MGTIYRGLLANLADTKSRYTGAGKAARPVLTMEKHEFAMTSGDHQARLLFSGDGDRAAVVFGDIKREMAGVEAGAALWDAMRESGINANHVNGFDLHEGSSSGKRIATLRPVLEGARVVWLVLYRADKDASVFRPVGNRQRIGDAFDACFTALRQDLFLPHKP